MKCQMDKTFTELAKIIERLSCKDLSLITQCIRIRRLYKMGREICLSQMDKRCLECAHCQIQIIECTNLNRNIRKVALSWIEHSILFMSTMMILSMS